MPSGVLSPAQIFLVIFEEEVFSVIINMEGITFSSNSEREKETKRKKARQKEILKKTVRQRINRIKESKRQRGTERNVLLCSSPLALNHCLQTFSSDRAESISSHFCTCSTYKHLSVSVPYLSLLLSPAEF